MNWRRWSRGSSFATIWVVTKVLVVCTFSAWVSDTITERRARALVLTRLDSHRGIWGYHGIPNPWWIDPRRGPVVMTSSA